MREILFRGKWVGSWSLDGEWAYGSYVHQDGSHQIYLPYGYDYTFEDDHVLVFPKTVGQFTGLFDKNGTKIFEGDIVKNVIDDNIAVVQWFEEHSAFMLYGKIENRVYFLYDNNFNHIEVVGNIYDNPELLEN